MAPLWQSALSGHKGRVHYVSGHSNNLLPKGRTGLNTRTLYAFCSAPRRRQPGRPGLTVLILIFLFCPAIAFAKCTDAPRPGVEWIRCFLNERSFTDIDITNGTVRDSSFSRATLDNAIFENVDARRAKFVSSSMRAINLRHANLRDADMTKAILDKADLSHADLRSVRFFQASLRHVNLTGARLDNADFYRTDLSGAIWVDGETVCAEGSLGICK